VLNIKAAIAMMSRHNLYRVPYFQDLLAQEGRRRIKPDVGREIVRLPDNPMLRYANSAATEVSQSPKGVQLWFGGADNRTLYVQSAGGEVFRRRVKTSGMISGSAPRPIPDRGAG
jgi:hypothetical protein